MSEFSKHDPLNRVRVELETKETHDQAALKALFQQRGITIEAVTGVNKDKDWYKNFKLGTTPMHRSGLTVLATEKVVKDILAQSEEFNTAVVKVLEALN